jgi:hypothetical protein
MLHKLHKKVPISKMKKGTHCEPHFNQNYTLAKGKEKSRFYLAIQKVWWNFSIFKWHTLKCTFLALRVRVRNWGKHTNALTTWKTQCKESLSEHLAKNEQPVYFCTHLDYFLRNSLKMFNPHIIVFYPMRYFIQLS